MKQVNNDDLNSDGLIRPLDQVAPSANSRCSDSSGSVFDRMAEINRILNGDTMYSYEEIERMRDLSKQNTQHNQH